MKLQFKNQAFQKTAMAAVCDVFEGQPYHDLNAYTVDPGTGGRAGRVTLPPGCAKCGGSRREVEAPPRWRRAQLVRPARRAGPTI